jgi:hypothetical protein
MIFFVFNHAGILYECLILQQDLYGFLITFGDPEHPSPVITGTDSDHAQGDFSGFEPLLLKYTVHDLIHGTIPTNDNDPGVALFNMLAGQVNRMSGKFSEDGMVFKFEMVQPACYLTPVAHTLALSRIGIYDYQPLLNFPHPVLNYYLKYLKKSFITHKK